MTSNAIKDCFFPQLYKKTKDLGICLSRLYRDQLAFDAMNQINDFMPNRRDVCIFLENWESSGNLVPPTAVYQSELLFNFNGNVICTSVETLITALKCPRINKVIWYITEVSDLQIYDEKQIRDLLQTKKIIKVTVNKEYKDMICYLYNVKPQNILSKYNPDFNIEFFCDIT